MLFRKVYSKNTVYKGIDAPSYGYNGTFVDIFPIENFPKRFIFVRKFFDLGLKFIGSTLNAYNNDSVHFKKMMKQDKEAYFSYRLRRFIGFFFSFLPYHKWAKLYDRFVQYPLKTGKLHDPTGDFRWVGYKESVLLPPRKMEFEGHLVYVPNKIEEYLQSEFGNDYMKLPPEDKRVRHYAEVFMEDKTNCLITI